MVQLIGDLPRAEEEAAQHYQEIKENWYQYQTLGKSRNAEEGDDFVYEYVGDVVNETVLRKRMREYAEEGIQHFYFMMLQREQYIDATKRGGKGRFANHSCNPNCYVAKWVVGKRIRMGIFAKRDIEENEELTFNYNVDRYGHDPQKCYCGEANCAGFLGGKTQTDVRANEMLGALGAASKSTTVKGRDAWNMAAADDPIPLEPSEAQYIISSLRQLMNERTFLIVILKRIGASEADAIRELMQLRCFGLLAGILEENYTETHTDKEIVEIILQSWQSWPLMNRGKIVQSGIEEKLKVIAQGEDETLKELADKQLLTKWSTLEETGYRIPKRKNEDLLEAEDRSKRLTASESPPHDSDPDPQPIPVFKATPLLGGGAHRRIGPLPPPPPPEHSSSTPEPNLLRRPTKSELDAIIARASETASPVPSSIALPTPSSDGTPINGSGSGRSKKDWSKATYEEKQKRMTKLIGEVVVKTLSKWKGEFTHESSQITDKIAETEMRRYGHSNSKFEKLSDEKTEKVKKFVKLSAAKYISRQKKQRQGSDSTPNDLEVEVDTALTTPNDGESKVLPFPTSSATPSGSTPDAPASSLADMQLDSGSARA
ncbi:SET domains protein, partial [Rhizoctonia solani]